ncbi:MAG: thioesterase family protein [Gammaproteobacteria bacterium]
MKTSLTTGLSFNRRVLVDAPRTIAFMGEEGRVYSTPALVSDIEYACRDLLFQHCDAGEDSVGVRVEVEHLAATPVGYWVEVAVTIVAIDGRRVSFEASVRDALEEIGKGRHTRFVVDTAKTFARLKTKKERLATA